MEHIQKHKFKDFIPLVGILIAISLFTVFMVGVADDPDIMYGMRMFMAGFFLIFGAFKIARWKGFVTAYREYDILAKRSIAYAYLYPLIEIGLGLSYLFAWNLFVTNIITIVVMGIGSVGVWQKLRMKEEIPCACLGVVFKIPMTKVTLFEDLSMATMAAIMLMI